MVRFWFWLRRGLVLRFYLILFMGLELKLRIVDGVRGVSLEHFINVCSDIEIHQLSIRMLNYNRKINSTGRIDDLLSANRPRNPQLEKILSPTFCRFSSVYLSTSIPYCILAVLFLVEVKACNLSFLGIATVESL